jgi:uncharacterized repeat protein (TIGR02543 family)
MMKKGIYSILAVLVVFAMVMTGCPGSDDGDGDNNSGTTTTVVTLSQTTLTVEIGGYQTITATTVPAGTALTWTSSDQTKATVTNGMVTGVAEGATTITAAAADGGKATCEVTVIKAITPEADIKVVGETLEHYKAKLVGVGHFGSNLGTDNEDGSYTFDGTAGDWSGGGAQYTFPTEKANDTWKLSNYNVVELTLKVTGSIQAKPTKYGNNTDLYPYPSGSQYITLTEDTESLTFVIEEAGAGLGFQRNKGGPATVKIEKAVFSKVDIRTITFASGDAGTNMAAIPPLKIPDERTVNFNGNYIMPLKTSLIWAGHTFVKWYNTTDSKDFDASESITKDLTLTAQWVEGEPDKVDMKLNLDPTSWGDLPSNAANQSGGWTWPSDYAVAEYNDGKLKLTFSGDNRQRAIIPLSTEQIDELMDSTGGVTFRIDGTVKKEDGTDSSAEFRLHLGNPSGTSGWNATDTGEQTALKDHLVEYVDFSSNKSKTTLGWFMIQAMYRDSSGDTTQSGFPKVIITINSITIDIGNTQ